MRLFTNDFVEGWTLLMISVLLIGGIILLVLGIIGEYVGRIYGEIKKRPLYIIRDKLGFEQN
jgi:dolichol-phosphate mannosyltransferase